MKRLTQKYSLALFCLAQTFIMAAYGSDLSGKIHSAKDTLPNVNSTSTASIKPVYSYISTKSGVFVCSVTDTGGNLVNCRITLTSPDINSVTIDPNESFAYVIKQPYMSDKVEIKIYSINQANGGLEPIGIIPEESTVAFKAPTSIAISSTGNEAYISTNYKNDSVRNYSINYGPNGPLFSFENAGPGFGMVPYQILANYPDTHLYLANGSSVMDCLINESGQIIFACLPNSKSGIDFAIGLAFQDEAHMYIANQTYVSLCNANPNGSLYPCKAFPGKYNNITSIASYGSNIFYVTDSGTDRLTKCTISSDGSIACTTAGSYSGLRNIAIYKPY